MTHKLQKVDFAIIGAGSGGLVGAYIASVLKAKTVLIEKDKMGGDCLNRGCVPSKALLRIAKTFYEGKKLFQSKLTTSTLPSLQANFSQVMQQVHQVIENVAPHDSKARYEKLGVSCLSGAATFLSPTRLQVQDQIIEARNILIATGANPLVPPIPGLKDISYLTSDNLWDLKELPQKLLILGGGPIGCELAQAFARLGSEVTIVEMAPHLLGREEPEVSTLMETTFQKEGIHIQTQHKAVRVETQTLVTQTPDQKEHRFAFDALLVALGRRANTKNLGIEALGIQLQRNATILTNRHFQAPPFRHIYAAGDAAGPYQFTHFAAYQATYATLHALFRPFFFSKPSLKTIPWVTYTDPEIAHLGLTEAQAKEQKLTYEVLFYSMKELDRAICEQAQSGFIKCIVHPKKGTVLGVTIANPRAGELLSLFGLLQSKKGTLSDLMKLTISYPSYPESLKAIAGKWKQKHAPTWAFPILEKYHTFRRKFL